MKKVLSIVIALALCVSTFSSIKADDLTDAQNDYKDMQESISGNKEQLNKINKQKDSTQKAVDDLDKKMDDTADKLSAVNKSIEDVNKEINAQEKRIEETEKSIVDGKELFDKRVKALYINGSESYLELLLNSGSISDFISRMETVSKLMEYDKQVLADMEQKKEELKNEKLSLQKKKESMVGLKNTADQEYKNLSSDSDKKKDYMAQLEKDKAKYEKLIEEEESESKAIGEMIKKIQDRKAEEARKNAQNNRGGSTTPISANSSIGKLYCVTGKPYVITSPFGPRVHPVLKTVRMHTGIDIGVYSGTPIYALADGVVIYSGSMSGYGNVVMIDHGSLTSLYAHNSSLVVKEGQTVKGGQLISYSGNTGLSSGPHLHFEIRNASGTAINPINYYIK